MKIFVVIVSYNGIKWLDKLIKSIESQIINCETIIVDNGSTDGSVELIKKTFPNIKLIECHKNLGFGSANNKALELAIKENADYVFLLNQDAWLEANTLNELVNLSIQYKEYGILAPLRKINNEEVEGNVLQNILSDNQRLFSDLLIKNEIKDIYDINFIGAAGWLITKDCLHKVGGFDPLFFHYGEDNDYCNRVKHFEFKIGICPKISMYHDVGIRNPSVVREMRKSLASDLLKLKFNRTKTLRFYLFFIKNFWIDSAYNNNNFFKKILKLNKSRKESFFAPLPFLSIKK